MRQMAISVRYNFGHEANPAEFVALLRPLLGSDDPSLRLSAARDLSCAKVPESRAALELRSAPSLPYTDGQRMRDADMIRFDLSMRRWRCAA